VDLLSLDDDFASSSSAGSGGVSGLSSASLAKLDEAVKTASLTRGLNNKTTLVDNEIMEITVAADYRAHQGRLNFTLYNKGNYDLSRVEFTLDSTDALVIRVQAPSQRISSGDEGRVAVAVECMRPFLSAPTASLSFSVENNSYRYPIPMPISVSSFCVPLPTDKTTYMNRWKSITGTDTESQQVFPSSGRMGPITSDLLPWMRGPMMTTGMAVGQAEGLDGPEGKTFTGSTTFMTGTMGADGKAVAVGVLLRLEAEPNHNKFRVTVRATHPMVSQAIKEFIVNQLS
jgi:hypothetical protein